MARFNFGKEQCGSGAVLKHGSALSCQMSNIMYADDIKHVLPLNNVRCSHIFHMILFGTPEMT